MSATPCSASARSSAPSRAAEDMAQTILSHRDVLDSVLAETVESAGDGTVLESGRTFCPDATSGVLGPGARFPRSVRLRSCPWGASGIVHTHVTHGELTSPEHSLPDMANVLLTDLDASVVLGTDASDVLLSPVERAPAVEQFEQAVGVGVEEPEDVVTALERGAIPDPPAARQRVRSRLSGLFRTETTPFPRYRDAVDTLRRQDIIAPTTYDSHGLTGCHTHHHVSGVSGGLAPRALHRARASADAASFRQFQTDGAPDIRGEVVGTVVGLIAGEMFRFLIFG